MMTPNLVSCAGAKAVRLVGEHRDEYPARMGMSAETLRKWVRQAEIDDGQTAGVSTAASRELRELRKKNREL